MYKNYLHGWDEKVNQKLSEHDEQFNYGYIRPEVVMDIEDQLGFGNNENEINDLVSNYQEFLNQSGGSASDLEEASMLPNQGTPPDSIKREISEDSDTYQSSPTLTGPTNTGLTQILEEFHFNQGVPLSSTRRSRRDTIRRDYKKMHESGF